MRQRASEPIDQPEQSLLLACATTHENEAARSEIRNMLQEGVDWTVFARKAIGHGVARLVGGTLARVATDMVPETLLDAFLMNTEQTRTRNRALLKQLGQLLEALVNSGAEAIAFEGPVLSIRAYGDLGLHMAGDPAFLVREPDIITTVRMLRDRGYEQDMRLTVAQLDFIRYLEGNEKLFNRALGIGADVCSRLTPINMSINIDLEGLWRRAWPTPCDGPPS